MIRLLVWLALWARRPLRPTGELQVEKVVGTGEILVLGTAPEVVYIAVECLEERGIVVALRPSWRVIGALVFRRHVADGTRWLLCQSWRLGFLDLELHQEWTASAWTWRPWRTLARRRAEQQVEAAAADGPTP